MNCFQLLQERTQRPTLPVPCPQPLNSQQRGAHRFQMQTTFGGLQSLAVGVGLAESAWPLMPLETAEDWLELVEGRGGQLCCLRHVPSQRSPAGRAQAAHRANLLRDAPCPGFLHFPALTPHSLPHREINPQIIE